MAIERLSFPNHLHLEEGLEVDVNPHTQEAIIEIVASHIHLIETLGAGEYNLTPEVWTRNSRNASI